MKKLVFIFIFCLLTLGILADEKYLAIKTVYTLDPKLKDVDSSISVDLDPDFKILLESTLRTIDKTPYPLEFSFTTGYGFEKESTKGYDIGYSTVPAYLSIKPYLNENIYLIGSFGFNWIKYEENLKKAREEIGLSGSEIGLYYGLGAGFSYGNFIFETIYESTKFDYWTEPLARVNEESVDLIVGYKFQWPYDI